MAQTQDDKTRDERRAADERAAARAKADADAGTKRKNDDDDGDTVDVGGITATKDGESPEEVQKALGQSAALGHDAAFATSMNRATGDLVEIPKTPDEIAQRGTDLGIAGDIATGGNTDLFPERTGSVGVEPKFQRVWAMDADQTERNRNNVDQLKPDCSVQL